MNKRVSERVKKGLSRFRPVLESAHKRDVSESDTVHIVHDMLAEILGWDKYADVTTEFEIRGTYCDLAIKHEGKVKFLIEVKAINHNLKENHLRQAVNYATNNGTEWVILTNGISWQAYQVKFEQPVRADLVFEIDFLDRSASKEEFMSKVFTICKEAVKKEAIEEFAARRQLVNKYTITAILTGQTVLDTIRHDLRRIKRDLSVSPEEIKKILDTEVIKRELIEGDELKEARRRVKRAAAKNLRTTTTKKKMSGVSRESVTPEAAPSNNVVTPSTPDPSENAD